MQNFTVIFSHGRESGPWGTKIREMAKVAEGLGCRVLSRDDTDTRDPELRVTRLIEEAAGIDGPIVLVGSSMGGYVAAAASNAVKPLGLFLMAPALGMDGYAEQSPQPSTKNLAIVHGWDDDVVPMGPVIEFARQNRATIHLVPAGHALLEQVDWLCRTFGLFLENCLSEKKGNRWGRLLATL